MLQALKSEDWRTSIDESAPTARVLVAVGNALVRAGLRAVLADMPRLNPVGEAHDARQGLEMARRLAPDLLLLDIDLAQDGNFKVLRALSADHPSLRILVVGMSVEFECLLEALQAGATGCIQLDCSMTQIQRTISEALAGELAVDTRMAREAVRRFTNRSVPLRAVADCSHGSANRLSPREHEVLRLLARGLSNREIAQNLVITAHTAKIHVEHICTKLEVRGRTEAAVRGIQFGYVSA